MSAALLVIACALLVALVAWLDRPARPEHDRVDLSDGERRAFARIEERYHVTPPGQRDRRPR